MTAIDKALKSFLTPGQMATVRRRALEHLQSILSTSDEKDLSAFRATLQTQGIDDATVSQIFDLSPTEDDEDDWH